MARIFNSAVIPYEGDFVGVFRGEQVNGIPFIYFGRSADGIHWTFDQEKIQFLDENGEPFQPVYAYDPRLVEVDGTYYVIWVPGCLRRSHRHGKDYRLSDICPGGKSVPAV